MAEDPDSDERETVNMRGRRVMLQVAWNRSLDDSKYGGTMFENAGPSANTFCVRDRELFAGVVEIAKSEPVETIGIARRQGNKRSCARVIREKGSLCREVMLKRKDEGYRNQKSCRKVQPLEAMSIEVTFSTAITLGSTLLVGRQVPTATPSIGYILGTLPTATLGTSAGRRYHVFSVRWQPGSLNGERHYLCR